MPTPIRIPTPQGHLTVATRADLTANPTWQNAFADHRQDARYYAIVEDTIKQGFDFRYFVLEDSAGQIKSIQPFFLLDQDILEGAGQFLRRLIAIPRKLFKRLLFMRTLMVGCAAGEGHLDNATPTQAQSTATELAHALRQYARHAGASLIVMKEFDATFRAPMAILTHAGFTRIPSFPMTRLKIDYKTFEDYITTALSKNGRKNLRKKLRDADEAAGGPNQIQMQVLTDITPHIEEVYPLYLQVFDPATMKFEKLTKEYFCRLGQDMPDRARFFIWRKDNKAIAFSCTFVFGDTFYDQYLGMDYAVALDLHLYFYTFRDVLTWSINQGLKWYVSTSLGYEPKLHLGCELKPLDLYVRHRWPIANFFMKRFLPYLEPTRHDKTLPKFPNYARLWSDDAPA